MNKGPIVTRFAPSPTGFMHVGNVRSALFAWLWTRKNNGTFILRIEDTDKEREVAGSKEHIIESLKWLGITFDQGPYFQSERLDLYKQYAHKLIDAGFAYPDPYSSEEVEAFRKQAEAEKRAFLFRDHRPENFEAWDGTKPLRFKVPEIKSYAWHDEVFGDLSAGPEALDDFILIKGDGYPTYNFAHIVDDIEMGITLVMRGQEYISSTPKFLAVYEALGVQPPLYACLPHIMADGGQKKLGKRDGAKDILEYREEGYLPDAMINFLAFLGWNPGDDTDVLTREELIQKFDIARIQRAGAQLSEEKLNWLNREHIKKLSEKDCRDQIEKFLPESFRAMPSFTEERFQAIMPVMLERLEKFADIRTMIEAGELSFFFEAPTDLEADKLVFKGSTREETKTHLTELHTLLSAIPEGEWTLDTVKAVAMAYADTLPKRGAALHPLRFSLSAREKSPDPFTISSIIGKAETLMRLSGALALL